MRELLPRFARPCALFWLHSPSKFAAKMRASASLYFRFSVQIWNKNARASASLRSAMCFIFASVSIQIWIKNARASASLRSAFGFNLRSNFELKCELLHRFARPRALFSLQSPFKFGAKMPKLLPRFARPCALFRFNLRSNWDQKCESFCLASPGGRPLLSLQSPFKFGAKMELLPRFARPCALSFMFKVIINI